MFKYLIICITLITSSFASCDSTSVYIVETGIYSQECAAQFLNMTQLDYTNQMALAGSLVGFTFLLVTLILVQLTGRRT
ncbi:MAG: hypothetical protein COB67_08900 [SAR324 cluster bacterium]|uniref:Uncharacterized protein n=1 Tax=SAR324 cluster bacterium TaxID=2024889 RepID=A0A2A4T174_9DELT|nr:MAG: hypothetical protein COB67_08900 [SAR324 cluster bacterium]